MSTLRSGAYFRWSGESGGARQGTHHAGALKVFKFRLTAKVPDGVTGNAGDKEGGKKSQSHLCFLFPPFLVRTCKRVTSRTFTT